ncbi:glycosyltransferase [Faecalicoccus acidiformans]|uniref:glycosyltransferase n=1 Tax=Faecalicoccus acidiformans TaxID=915173 RepID=UPI0025A408EC|nr:glycosyltransferase [Faecalicoccus acidiformans]MDM8203644.1 glycosyltransferase [Faecalicoccus acidiformans]
MKNLPLISCIMSTYNEDISIIRQSIDSILNQTYSNIEFIIINDNPKREELELFLNNVQRKDSRIRVFKNFENLGLVNSLNKGLKYAKGVYIARMDADDISEGTRFEVQYNYLREYSLDIIGCKYKIIDEKGNWIRDENVPVDRHFVASRLKISNCIAHPSFFGKRVVFEQLGGYRNVDTCEDYDFLLRALAHGYRIANCEQKLLEYRISINGISQQNKYKQSLISNYLSHNLKCINNIDIDMLNDIIIDEQSQKRFNLYCFTISEENYFLKKIFLILKYSIIFYPFFQLYVLPRIKVKIINFYYIGIRKEN